MQLKVQPELFREAYMALHPIVKLSEQQFTASPRDGLINIEVKHLTKQQLKQLMIWKLQYSA